MDLGTLIGAALGAVVGTGSTVLADRLRWSRDRISRHEDAAHAAVKQDLALRRDLYGQYLAALSLATHQLRGLLRDEARRNADRSGEADKIMSESAAYLLRYQIRMISPHLEQPVEASFDALRGLRRCVAVDRIADMREQRQAMDAATGEITASINALLSAMRDEFAEGAPPANKGLDQ
jgi:hypothetical protein